MSMSKQLSKRAPLRTSGGSTWLCAQQMLQLGHYIDYIKLQEIWSDSLWPLNNWLLSMSSAREVTVTQCKRDTCVDTLVELTKSTTAIRKNSGNYKIRRAFLTGKIGSALKRLIHNQKEEPLSSFLPRNDDLTPQKLNEERLTSKLYHLNQYNYLVIKPQPIDFVTTWVKVE